MVFYVCRKYSTFSAEISCGGKLVSHDHLESYLKSMSPNKLNQLFPLPLKSEWNPLSTTPATVNEVL